MIIFQEKDYEIWTLKKENTSLKLDKKNLNNKVIKMNKQIQQFALKLENINQELHKKEVQNQMKKMKRLFIYKMNY